jgi:phosphate transport system permease protein
LTLSTGLVGSQKHRSAEWLIERALALFAVLSGSLILLIVLFVVEKSVPLIQRDGLAFLFRDGWDTTVVQAWEDPGFWNFGALPLIVGTAATVLGALASSVAIGTGCAVFLSEISPSWIVRPLEAVLRLLAGIPSVVFGLVGLTVVVPAIQKMFITEELTVRYIDVPLDGTSLLAGVLVLTFMILPFYVTVSTDALRAVPRTYREAGAALGLTKWRVIRKVVLPSALPGLFTGAILAVARGVGEAIAMSMVAGGLSNIPSLSNGFVFFLEPVRTLASAIVENGEGMSVPQVQAALFGLGTVLLMVCIALSLLSRAAYSWFYRQTGIAIGRTY